MPHHYPTTADTIHSKSVSHHTPLNPMRNSPIRTLSILSKSFLARSVWKSSGTGSCSKAFTTSCNLFCFPLLSSNRQVRCRLPSLPGQQVAAVHFSRLLHRSFCPRQGEFGNKYSFPSSSLLPPLSSSPLSSSPLLSPLSSPLSLLSSLSSSVLSSPLFTPPWLELDLNSKHPG